MATLLNLSGSFSLRAVIRRRALIQRTYSRSTVAEFDLIKTPDPPRLQENFFAEVRVERLGKTS
jgi:hypothetical protein